MGTSLRVLSESYPVNGSPKYLRPCSLDEGSLTIGRVNHGDTTFVLLEYWTRSRPMVDHYHHRNIINRNGSNSSSGGYTPDTGNR